MAHRVAVLLIDGPCARQTAMAEVIGPDDLPALEFWWPNDPTTSKPSFTYRYRRDRQNAEGTWQYSHVETVHTVQE